MKNSAFLVIGILVVMLCMTTQAHPIQPDRFFDTFVKRGSCPKPGIGVCAELCSINGGCSNGQLCCFNGCGHQCMNPVKKSRGKCPNIQCFVSDCIVDSDCNNGMKCCSGCCAKPI